MSHLPEAEKQHENLKLAYKKGLGNDVMGSPLNRMAQAASWLREEAYRTRALRELGENAEYIVSTMRRQNMEVGEGINDGEFEEVGNGLRGITQQRQELFERAHATQRWFDEKRGTLEMRYRQDYIAEVDDNIRILNQNSSESGPLADQVHKVDTALRPLIGE